MALTVEIRKRLGCFSLEVSFRAEDGETLALLGASGCGKSVTLKCIAGILRPDEGHIQLDGRVLYDSAARVDLPPQRRRVGYLFQQYALFPHMTVEQNIGAAVPQRDRRAAVVAEKVRAFHLEGLERKRPFQLSGGQQQRVALARALVAQPSFCCWTSLFPPWTATSNISWSWNWRTPWRPFPARRCGFPTTGGRCTATAAGFA